jgi:signal transduction histidine kinase
MAAAVVPLVTVLVVVYLLTNQALTDQFRRFQVESGKVVADVIKGMAVDYYDDRGAWDDIESNFNVPGFSALTQQRIGGRNFILTDESGKVLVSSDPKLKGRSLTEAQLQEGVPIEVKGQRVGTLLVGPVVDNFSEQEARFLASLQHSVWLIGAMGGILGILLILFFYRQLQVFVRRFSQTAQVIAAGDLNHHLPVSTSDEIGQLGRAFNEMVDKLEKLQQMRSNMIADIAHELRTPMTVIRAHLEALTSGILPMKRESLSAMHEHTLLLSRLLDDLMELHLAEAGGLTLHREKADLEKLIQGIAAQVRPAFQSQGLRLDVCLPEGHVPCLDIDVERMKQVILNLITNAQHHTPQGGRVCIAVDTQDREVRIQVSDTGTGIAPENIPYVFERFYSRKASCSLHNGAGLGLAISKALVEAQGGRIRVDSQLGQGTRFTVSLPVTIHSNRDGAG